jgi:hypothetical protein
VAMSADHGPSNPNPPALANPLADCGVRMSCPGRIRQGLLGARRPLDPDTESVTVSQSAVGDRRSKVTHPG